MRIIKVINMEIFPPSSNNKSTYDNNGRNRFKANKQNDEIC